jgi:hypothetical protein
MALFFECMLSCARKVLDTADLVRDWGVRGSVTKPCVPLLASKQEPVIVPN